MLVDLLNTPKDKNAWNLWSYSNRDIIREIRNAIQIKTGKNLVEYNLDPVTFDKYWLKRNAQAHTDFTQALGAQGVDLEDLDFEDDKQVDAWIAANYQELFDAAALLQIG